MVNTDDNEIKECAIHYGTNVPFKRVKKIRMIFQLLQMF